MRRLIAPLLAGLACLAAPVPGCVLSGQPCSDGSQCPTGYACSQGSCAPVGGDGAMVLVHVGLPDDGINRQQIYSLVFESRLDTQLECLLWRDPTDQALFDSLEPEVVVPVPLGDPPTEVMVPAGRSLIVVRGTAEDGTTVVGQACQVHTFAAGDWDEVYFELVRANGQCGDGFRDAGEECDAGASGSEFCTPPGDAAGGCRTRAMTVAAGGCITGQDVACTFDDDAGEDGDGRCLVGWIEDGGHLRVAARDLDGREDPDERRGYEVWDEGVRLLRVASWSDQAAAVWVGSDGVLRGKMFNNMAQPGYDVAATGDASGAVVAFADYFDRGDGRPVLAAGWIDGAGDGVVEDFDGATGTSLARRTLDMASPPGERPVAEIFSSGVVVTWAVPSFGEDVDEAIVASRVLFDDPSGSEPFQVSDNPSQAQTEPSLTRMAYDRAFFVWTDANQTLGGDASGTGIRGRRVYPDDTGASMPINSSTDGDQNHPTVASGYDYVIAAWSDDDARTLSARYLDTYGRPQYQPFGTGQDTDFTVAGVVVGRPAIAAGQLVYFAWLEEPCGERGGARLMLRTLPAPH